MDVRRLLGRIAAGAGLVGLIVGVQGASGAPPSAPSTIVTVDPARILDTRNAIGIGTTTPVPADSSISLQVTGQGGVPSGATGVVLTITGTSATAPTFITATPAGTARSTTSVLNITPGEDVANTVTMSIGAGGKIELYNSVGSVHLIADVTGYLLPQGASVETTTIELSAYSAEVFSGPGTLESFGCRQVGNTSNGSELVLDVPLPRGAAVQRVDFRYFDDNFANITFLLIEVDGAFTAASPPSTSGTLSNNQVSSNIATGYGVVTMNPTGGDAVADNVRYYIDVFSLGTPSGTHSFCGASVTYARVV